MNDRKATKSSTTSSTGSDLDTRCINTIRFLAVDAVERAQSGHPGMPMGAAPMAYVLWTRFLRFNPRNPAWPDRDRFVLSAGHGSALLYSLLHLTGYDVSLDDLRQFRQWGSTTPGHPERGRTPGVEVTTGPLGQGFGNAVGLAMAERHLASRFNRTGFPIVNHYTYAIASDGDMMEGVASEAASLAGHLGLGRLVCLYDSNHVTLSASTRIAFSEDVGRRFDAYGWHVQKIEDGNDLAAITAAISAAREEAERPSLIVVRTHIGYGSPNKQDTFSAHGSPLGADEVRATKKNLGWPLEPEFHIPADAGAHFREAIDRGSRLEAEWETLLQAYGGTHPDLLRTWRRFHNGQAAGEWTQNIPTFDADPEGMPTRSAGHRVENAIAKDVHNLFGGSADLDPSTKTALDKKGSFERPGSGDDRIQGSPGGDWGYDGANVAFGVREHAMGAILNGIAAHGGLIPFGATFLVFSDYMRPAIRLAALSRLKVIYIFTHDSIMLGEDGPTHEPIEHVMSLRAIPDLTLIRPADANETAQAWKVALQQDDAPVALVLTRQKLPIVDRSRLAPADGLARGAYVLADCEDGDPELILIATGSEVHPALGAHETLTAERRRVRVVSMPSWELFERQPDEYRRQVLPPEVTARITIEAGTSCGWHKYAGESGRIIGMDRFGASAPGTTNQEKFGFTAERIVEEAHSLLQALSAESRSQNTRGSESHGRKRKETR